MKPTFALDFRHDAIGLLHRTSRGWQAVGVSSIDAPDLPEALGYLRSTALGLAPRGLTTKLVIPNSQILYLTVNAPGPDAGRRRRQITKALEGRTPYAVEDLAFDWSGSGPEVQVAVIARETLAEAEAFATEHRFNPLCFVAVPEPGMFKGEPWFGLTGLAPSLLPDGARLDRDQDPIVIIARDPLRSEAATAPDAAPEPMPVVAETAPVAAAEPAMAAMAAPEPEPAPLVSDPVALKILTIEPAGADLAKAVAVVAAVVPEAAAQTVADAAAKLAAAPMPASSPGTGWPDNSPPPVSVLADPAPAEPVIAERAPAPPPPPVEPVAAPDLAIRTAPAEPDEAPMAVDVADMDEPALSPVQGDPALPDDLPPAPSTFAMAAFASRRAGEVGAAAKAGGAAPALGPAATRPPGDRASTTIPPVVTPPAGPVAPAQPGGAGRPSFGRPPQQAAAPASGAGRAVPPVAGRPASKDAAPAKGLRGMGALVTAPAIPGGKTRRPVLPPQVRTAAGPVPADSAASLQPASAARKPASGLGSRAVPVRGKPRHLGLILTGLLLLFLALVAAWSTFFLASFQSSDTPTEAVAEAEPAAPTPDPVAQTDPDALPAPEDEMLADMQDPAEFAEDPPTDPAQVLADLALTDPVAAEPAPATGIVADTAPAVVIAETPQDEIFLAAMDAAPQPPDALALPQPDAVVDVLPAAAVPPPPFGTVYQFEANGLIRPTPEGILTPEGVLLVAGPPPVIPPQRPAGLAGLALPQVLPEALPGAAAQPVVPPVADPAVAAVLPVPADPALAAVRPRARPAGLVPPTAVSEDDASLAPGSDGRFASLRPRARPAGMAGDRILDEGAAVRAATQSASLAVIDPVASTSPLALVVALKPAQRPRDMTRAVEAAVAAAVRQPDPRPEPEPEPQVAAKPKVEPEADDEPEIATAMPQVPTRASVAKQATFVNAINLSKTNLIGVYGTQSSRYALVRLSSGRYKKVKVGDSLDGGKIAAITATEVRYQKGGKMVTLALPKG